MATKDVKFVIYYNTGLIQTSSNMNATLVHMVEVGVIKFIYDLSTNKAWIRSEENTAIEIVVTNVVNI